MCRHPAGRFLCVVAPPLAMLQKGLASSSLLCLRSRRRMMLSRSGADCAPPRIHPHAGAFLRRLKNGACTTQSSPASRAMLSSGSVSAPLVAPSPVLLGPTLCAHGSQLCSQGSVLNRRSLVTLFSMLGSPCSSVFLPCSTLCRKKCPRPFLARRSFCIECCGCS